MNRLKYLFVFVLALIGLSAGCGGSNSSSSPPIPPNQIKVSISPTSASLYPGRTQQFTATVTGTLNTEVAWSATCGTISEDGLYTAPLPTNTITCTVTATSRATSPSEPPVSASAKVTVLVQPKTVSITCLPSPIAGNQSSQCSEEGIEGTAQWFVEEIPGGNANVGTITSSGLYVPPETVAGSMTVTIKAVSALNPASWGITTVIVVFEWAQFYSPYPGSNGEATAIALNSDSSRLVAAYSSSIAGSSEKTAGLLLYDAQTGEQNDAWTNSPIPSRINALSFSPDGNVYAAGFTGGDDAHPEERAAWLIRASVGDTLQVLYSKNFQLGGKRTEARAISVQNGRIYLAVNSAFEECGLALNSCSGDWFVALDLEGNIISKSVVGNTHRTKSGDYVSITDLWVGPDHYWVVGNRFKLIDGKLQPSGTYRQRGLIGEEPHLHMGSGPEDLSFDSKLAGELNENIFFGLTAAMDSPADINRLWFRASKNDQQGGMSGGNPFFWNGDNDGPVSINILKDVLLDSAGRLIALGSLSKLDSTDLSVTNAGAISWKTDNDDPYTPREIIWKNRFDAVPGGTAQVFNAAATVDSRGGVFFVGAGLNNETMCGNTPCVNALVAKFTPPIP